MTQPQDEAADRLADDDHDTIAETRPLPEPAPAEARSQRPELLPTIGHIGRYALKYTIGEGGLGTVYAAHDPLLSRLIAIKTLHVDLPAADREQFNALFLNEAKAAGSLSHPQIVTVYDAGTSDQGTYIAMELLKGKDLRQLLAMGWKPTPAQAALIVRRVADALSYVHHKGVIHRDIKPANIFMVGRTQPRVLDFGIARIRQAESRAQRDDPQSRFQEIVGGSPYYMAPEQVQHLPVDRRVDVYALGVVLYELLVYKRAFAGNSLEEIADAVLNRPVPLAHEANPDVPSALSEIVARAMHRDPEQRTRSARRLASELRDWLDQTDQADAASLLSAGGARRVRPGLWSMAVAGWVAASAVGAWVMWQARTPAPEARPAAPVMASVPPVSQVAPLAKAEPVTPAALVAPAAPVTAPVLVRPREAAAPLAAASATAAPEAVPAVASVAPAGTVRLAISPWGEVLVDGRRMGVTPPMNQLSLPPGRHSITIRNEGAPDFRQTLVVQSGKAVTLKHQF